MRAVLCTLLLAYSSAALADCTDCRWGPLPARLQLGEALELEVSRPLRDGGIPLEALRLDALQHDFEIFERTIGHSALGEDMRLTLYARRSGTLPLAPPGHPPTTIEVFSDGPMQVEFTWRAEPADWVLHRSSRLTLEACSRGALRWERPATGITSGLTLIPLNPLPSAAQDNRRECQPQRWAWSATPSLPGALRIDPGMLEASRHGRRLRFPVPPLTGEVAAVPAWLPAGIALDEPQVLANEAPAEGRVDAPLVWHLRLRAAYSQATLTALLDAQLADSGAWAHYPPRIEAVSGEPTLWDIRLSAIPVAAGAFTPPELQFPWFDPARGTLRHTLVTTRPASVVDPLRQTLLRLLAALGALSLLVLLALALRQPLRDWHAHRRLLTRVARADPPEALHKALLSGTDSTTTAGWAEHFLRQRSAAELPTLVEQLNALRFGDSRSDFTALRQRLLQCLRDARLQLPARHRICVLPRTSLRYIKRTNQS